MKYFVGLLCLAFAVALPTDKVSDTEADPEENVGAGLYQGDIELRPGQDPHDRTALRNRAYRWPNGEIPYEIDTRHFTGSYLQLIRDGIKTLEDKTSVNGKKCLKFKPRTNERAYIRYQGGSGCHTPIGYHGTVCGVTLGRGCNRIGTAMHETMHGLGFWHEQNRPDRDNYITVVWSNIQRGYEHNYDKMSNTKVDTLGITYDYGSVMHYGAYFFAVDRSKPTIIVKQSGVTIGQRTHLSPSDIKEIQIYYGCLTSSTGTGTGTTPALTQAPHVSSETCTFERDFCTWTNAGGDQLNWIRRTGSTPSAGTGPSTDHSGSSTGHYAYLEASGHYHQKGYLLSQSLPPDYYCLSIYYHMYGQDEGSLKIEAVSSAGRRVIHTITGNQGNQWHHYLLNLHVSNGNFEIEIEGDTGSNYRSDIALDDLTIHKGQCSTLQTGKRDADYFRL